MGKRKTPYRPKSFESTGAGGDTSANIYMSMLLSDSWKALSKNAMILYVYCKEQLYAEKRKPNPNPELKHLTEQEQARCFTMNRAKREDLYGLYSNSNQFYKDMKLLIKHGFVELIESGRTTRTKNIYMLSDKWHKPS